MGIEIERRRNTLSYYFSSTLKVLSRDNRDTNQAIEIHYVEIEIERRRNKLTYYFSSTPKLLSRYNRYTDQSIEIL